MAYRPDIESFADTQEAIGRAPLAVLGAALGVIVALVTVAVLWLVGLDVHGVVVGAVAGAVAGAVTTILGITS
ncbi:MAG: hypothetical protein QNJ81_15175 [Acidimicrobiia bacterium]|nr:hypothetical protein [Acidimicrobiia bacterium]